MAKRETAGIGLEDFKAPEFKPPVLSENYRTEMDRAANLHALADNSDPFARARIMCHMRGGLVLPSDVIAQASSKLSARGMAKGEGWNAPALAA